MHFWHKLLGVISVFLRAIILQTDGATECINNPTFFVNSPTKLILAVSSPTDRCSYSTAGPSIQWSRRKFYFMYDYQNGGQDQCIVSSTFCPTIDILVEASVS